jgi:hypothetical protein
MHGNLFFSYLRDTKAAFSLSGLPYASLFRIHQNCIIKEIKHWHWIGTTIAICLIYFYSISIIH